MNIDIEKIKEIKESIQSISDTLQDIIDGKITQSEAESILGLTPKAMCHELDDSVKDIIKTKLLKDSDIISLLNEVRTPGEQLILSILGYNKLPNDELIKLPSFDEGKLWDRVRILLTDREYQIVSSIFGHGDLVDTNRKTLSEVSNMIKSSYGTVNGTFNRSIHKLRSRGLIENTYPMLSSIALDIDAYLVKNVDKAMKYLSNAISDYSNTVNILNDAEAIRDAVELAKCGRLSEAKAKIKNTLIAAGIENTDSDKFSTIELEETDMSVRLYNCLKHAKINTLNQLIDMDYDDIRNIRNLGASTLMEIKSLLFKYFNIVRDDFPDYGKFKEHS